MFPAKNGVIYKFTSPSGKSYIGQTREYLSNGDKKGMEGRWRQHVNASKRNSQIPFHLAIHKYGSSTFEKEILVHCEIDKLNFFEDLCITINNSLLPNGYNVHEGGKEHERTKEWGKNISEGIKAKLQNPEMRKKWSEVKKGKQQRCVRKKKRDENNGLPKYVIYYQYKHYKGYEVQYTPPYIDVKITKKFTKSKFSMEEKKNLAINFVNDLHRKYNTTDY